LNEPVVHSLRRELLLAALALGCLGLAWAFGKFASEMLEGELLGIDRNVQHWVALHRAAPAMAVAHVVTFLGAKAARGAARFLSSHITDRPTPQPKASLPKDWTPIRLMQRIIADRT